MPTPPPRHDDLRALFLNTTLTRSPELSHTSRLIGNARAVMEQAGAATEEIRVVDHPVAFGVQPDMREHGWDRDAWPEISTRVQAADIMVIGSPIWLGEESSVCRMVIERLYAHSGETNSRGQSGFYGKVGGCLVTGNEDGSKHVAMTVLYALQHVGFTIPPQAAAGWVGEAGPGPSYGDDGAGLDNDFTRRNTTFMAWNCLHMARLLKEAGGLPAHGNDASSWAAGERFGHPEPEKPEPEKTV